MKTTSLLHPIVSVGLLAGVIGASGCTTTYSSRYVAKPTPPASSAPSAASMPDPSEGSDPNEYVSLNLYGGEDAQAGETTAYESSVEPAASTVPAPYEPVVRAAEFTGGRATSAPNVTQVSFSGQGGDFDPDVSSDGTRMVFASTQHRDTSDIYIKDINGRTVTQLTSDPAQDVMPKFSPDGKRIAFSSNRAGNWDIFVMPTTGGRALEVTADAADDLHPSWSADGGKLVFCRLGQTSGRWEMWVVDLAGTGLETFIGYGVFPEWCPTSGTGANGSDKIAFQRSRERGDRAFGIWTVDFANGQAFNPTEVVSASGTACINPAWSPDGEWLAYATVPALDGPIASSKARPATAELRMVAVNASASVNLAVGRSLNLMPTWTNDYKIFFVSDRNGTDNIWSTDATGAILAATGSLPEGLTRTTDATSTVGETAEEVVDASEDEQN